MNVRTSTFFDSGARRRKYIYAAIFLLATGAAAAILFWPGGGEKPRRTARDRAGTPGAERPDDAAEPNEAEPPAQPDGAAAAGATPPRPTPGDPARAPVEAARAELSRAMDLLREAMSAEPGSAEAKRNRKEALKAFLAAQRGFEDWLAEHPEEEKALDPDLKQLAENLYWLRKSMTAEELGAVVGGANAGTNGGRTRPDRDPPRPAGSTPPRPTTPPPFVPADEVARFVALAGARFAEGKPGEIVAAAEALIADERMAGHLSEVKRIHAEAAPMADFLAAARRGLAKRVNETIELALRKGVATGVLRAAEPELVLTTAFGESTIVLADLGAAELLARAAEGGWPADAASRRAAGAYLVRRGDPAEGARELVAARAGGADVAAYAAEIEKQLAASPDLRALRDWLAIEPRLAAPDAGLLPALRAFRRTHHGAKLFAERRAELFAAEAQAAAKFAYRPEMLFAIPAKISSRCEFKGAWNFEDEAQLDDFGREGEFRVAGGRLAGVKARAWVGRFDLTNVDVEFTSDSVEFQAGLWESEDRRDRGVNLVVAPAEEGGHRVSLHHADRRIGEEVVRGLEAPLHVEIVKRDDKYQVRLNRRVVLKETDRTGRAGQPLHVIGFVAGEVSAAFDDLAVAGYLDAAWAKGGGDKFANWISDWFVSPPWPIDRKTIPATLASSGGPAHRPFLPPAENGAAAGGGWKPDRVGTGWLDLNRIQKPNDGVAAAAAARIWSPEKRPAMLELLADDAAAAWLNGERIVDQTKLGVASRVPVVLQPGENVLYFEVAEDAGAWWVRARLLDKAGGPMFDVIPW